MATVKACVLRAPGTNCDIETAFAFEQVGAQADRLHLFRVLEQPSLLGDYQILCVPGGFSYGDDIGAGVIFSKQLSGRLGEALGDFLQSDTLVLGICNGFQVLLKAGLLPGGSAEWSQRESQPPQATLTWNDNGKYTAVWVHLDVCAGQNAFLRGIEKIDLPVAHAEGRIVVRDASVLSRWRDQSQIALRYSQGNGQPVEPGDQPLPYPANPNGSVANIAGLSDPTGRVLGMMPHPERFIHATQHPHWTRLGLSGAGDGLQIFRNGVTYFT